MPVISSGEGIKIKSIAFFSITCFEKFLLDFDEITCEMDEYETYTLRSSHVK